jgi:hypothetical protein
LSDFSSVAFATLKVNVWPLAVFAAVTIPVCESIAVIAQQGAIGFALVPDCAALAGEVATLTMAQQGCKPSTETCFAAKLA